MTTHHSHIFIDPEQAALRDGRWVRRGLVWVWRPNPGTRELDAERWAREEAQYDQDEARRAHNAYKKGARSEWAKVGHRVYYRRLHREQRARKREGMAA